MNSLADMLDLGELLRRAVKYLVEGLMVAIASLCYPEETA